jgi:ATP-dependent RNA helicase DeaD
LLTHADSERILCGLVRSFFSGVTFDVDEAAAAARRERTLPPEPKSASSADDAADEDDESDDEGSASGPAGKRKRRRRRGRSETSSGSSAAAPLAVEDSPAPVASDDALTDGLLEDAPPVLEDMTTLYFNVGKRDGLEPRDLATLLVDTCGLGAEDIGRVRVKDRHTFVGVPTERADAVISSLQGQSIKNRALQVERARS